MTRPNRSEYWVVHKHNFLLLQFAAFCAGISIGTFLGIMMMLVWS